MAPEASLRSRARRGIDRLRWRLLGRAEDVILASFPKSGRNWLLFMVANAIREETGGGEEVTFRNIHDRIPESFPASPGAGWPRMVALHSLPEGRRGRTLYLVRDPRAVLGSYYEYLRDRWGRPLPPFPEFLRGREGARAWRDHAEAWAGRSDCRVIRYEALQADPEGTLADVLDFVRADARAVEPALVRRAVAASSLEAMRRVEERHGLPDRPGANPDYHFVRPRVGRARPELGADDLAYLEREAGRTMRRFGYL